MNAFQPYNQPLQPIPQRQVKPRPKRRLRQRSYEVMALETTVKIGVNLVISAAAVSALTQLLPYHWSQQDKLREMRTEVQLMEAPVNKLRAEFIQNFDPRQANSIMQKQSYRFDPNQVQIVLTQNATTAEQRESSP